MLILPNFAALEAFARTERLAFSSRQELIGIPEVHARYADIVRSVNEDLAQFERLKKFRLIADELSSANGTLTASLKIRRRAIEERFKREIDEIYSEAEASRDLQ